jgi:hypothetical protein
MIQQVFDDTNSTKAAKVGEFGVFGFRNSFNNFDFVRLFSTEVRCRLLPHRFNARIWSGIDARFFEGTDEDILVPPRFFGVGASCIRARWWSVGCTLHEVKMNVDTNIRSEGSETE